jgi:Holliday junction resolvase RusA-like endonuclease
MPDPVLVVDVPGKPRGQGSMTLWRGPGGMGRARYAPDVVAHRNLVVAALVDGWSGREPLAGPVGVRILAEYPRPRGHWGTGRNASSLKLRAPGWVTIAPDLDKVARLVLDAATVAGVYRDDAQVCLLRAEKRYTGGGGPGRTTIEVFALDP